MAIDPMYPAKAGSPKTMLAEAITNSATSMMVVDSSVLPPAPNICVIGEDENAEVVGYTGINGNTITGLLRGLQGSGTTASPWVAGTAVARNFTSFDHDRFIDNINDLSANLALKAPIENPAFTGIPTAPTPNTDDDSTQIATTEYVQGELEDVYDNLALKAPIANPAFTGIPTSPTPNADDDSTQIATTEYVVSHDDFIVSGSASAGSAVTFTDSRINSEHWEVDWIIFGTSSRVTTHVDWTTNITNHTVTLNATFTGATTVKINMHYVQ